MNSTGSAEDSKRFMEFSVASLNRFESSGDRRWRLVVGQVELSLASMTPRCREK
jgi:hypothetical protein